MLASKDSENFGDCFFVAIFLTNEAIYGFSKKLGITWIKSFFALRDAQIKPDVEFGILCLFITIILLLISCKTLYKNIILDTLEPTFNLLFKNYIVFLGKYIAYSFTFIIFMAAVMSTLSLIFS